jgi:hypothetical protein
VFAISPVAVLDEQIPTVAQFRFSASAFASQFGIRIGSGFMRVIGPALPVKVHGRIARIIRIIVSRRPFLLETLQTRARLQQRPIHREMLIRGQIRLLGLIPYLRKKYLRHLVLQQPITVLREHSWIPDRLVQVHSHEPAEQHTVIDLLH